MIQAAKRRRGRPPKRPVWLERLDREPRTVVAIADLAPIIEAGIEQAGSAIAFATKIQRSSRDYTNADNAAKRLRTIHDGCVQAVPTTTADSICLAAGHNISQLPIPVLPSSPTAAELMVFVEADLRGDVQAAAERATLARRLLSFARGYIAGVSGTEEKLASQRKREAA